MFLRIKKSDCRFNRAISLSMSEDKYKGSAFKQIYDLPYYIVTLTCIALSLAYFSHAIRITNHTIVEIFYNNKDSNRLKRT